MARVFQEDQRQGDGRLAQTIRAFRHAQEDLSELRRSGLTEGEISRVMRSYGVHGVTPEEFISAKTTGEVMRLIEKIVELRAEGAGNPD